MNKAEKLKQKAYRKIPNYVGGFWVEYHFNEKELQLYVNEQSGENAAKYGAYIMACTLQNRGPMMYDEWKSNQEEQ